MALSEKCKQKLEETLRTLEETYGFPREHFWGKGLDLRDVEAGIVFPDGRNLLLLWGLDHSEYPKECWAESGICSWRYTRDGSLFIRCVAAPLTYDQLWELLRVVGIKRPTYIVFEYFTKPDNAPLVNKTFESRRDARQFLVKLMHEGLSGVEMNQQVSARLPGVKALVGRWVVNPEGSILPDSRRGRCELEVDGGKIIIKCHSAPLTKKQLAKILSLLKRMPEGEAEFYYYSRNKLLFSRFFNSKTQLEEFLNNMMEDITFGGMKMSRKKGKVILRTTAKDWEQLIDELEEQGLVYVPTDTGWSYLLDLNTGLVIPTADYGVNYLAVALEKGQVEIPWYREIEDYLEEGYEEFVPFVDELKVPAERLERIAKLVEKLKKKERP